ncbi:MAG: hypothetical protein WCH44_00575 [Betaproteobacteria bacterium]
MIDLFSASTPKLLQGGRKQDWFRAINPDARWPAIIDCTEGDFAVFETGTLMCIQRLEYQP